MVEGFRENKVAGAEQQDWREELILLLEDPDLTVKEATAEMVCRHRLSRRPVYQAALAIRDAKHRSTE